MYLSYPIIVYSKTRGLKSTLAARVLTTSFFQLFLSNGGKRPKYRWSPPNLSPNYVI